MCVVKVLVGSVEFLNYILDEPLAALIVALAAPAGPSVGFTARRPVVNCIVLPNKVLAGSVRNDVIL